MRDMLRITLLGGVSIQRGEEELTDNLFSKSQALFCYLALTRTPQPRHAMAGLFWGSMPEADARRNLRVNLTRMRRHLADHLHTTRQTLAFDDTQPYWLDVEQFESGIRAATAVTPTNLTRLTTAVDLYHGPFMAKLDVRDAPAFEEWVLRQRARYEQLAIQSLGTLIAESIKQQQYANGIRMARRLLELDSWREEAHRQLMWLLELDGQHSAALAQYEQCRDILERELGVDPAPETVTLYEQILSRREQQTSATRSLPPLPDDPQTVPFLAPPLVDQFTGRDAERTQLHGRLTPNDHPHAIALIGMGGVGKSSLAIQLAHDLRDTFPDGVLWANAATDDPTVIAEEWAAAFGYDFSTLPDMAQRGAALRAVLAEKTALLVLDDVTSAARVRPLLPDHGRCVTLITTRNSQFARTLGAERVRLHELSPEDGYALLARIVGEERAAAEPDVAHQICHLLQNLPLALTIAGRHLALRQRRPLADYVTRLQDERQRLAALKLADEEVRISFVISWQGLDDTQKRVFALLGVFAGRDFTAEAMAAVTGLDTYVTQDRLDDLVMLSMLSPESSQRYRQHPLLADFSREQLGRDDGAYLRLSQHFLAYAQAHQDDYTALRPEWENLSAGIEQAHRLHQWTAVRDYAAALRTAWFARGRFSEARAAYRWAREAAMALEDETGLAETDLAAAQASIEQGDYDEARTLLQQAAELFETHDHGRGIAQTRFEQARIANNQADFATALTLLDDSQQRFAEAGDTAAGVNILLQQAWIAGQQGDNARAAALGEEALAQLPDAPDPLVIEALRLIADARVMLFEQSDGAEHADHLQAADSACQRALVLSEEAGLAGETAAAHLIMAKICRTNGDLDRAEEYALNSLQLRRKLGDQRGQALVTYNMALIQTEKGHFAAGLELAQESVAISRRLQDRLGLSYGLRLVGDCHSATGAPADARAAWQAALDTAQQLQQTSLTHSLQQRLTA